MRRYAILEILTMYDIGSVQTACIPQKWNAEIRWSNRVKKFVEQCRVETFMVATDTYGSLRQPRCGWCKKKRCLRPSANTRPWKCTKKVADQAMTMESDGTHLKMSIIFSSANINTWQGHKKKHQGIWGILNMKYPLVNSYHKKKRYKINMFWVNQLFQWSSFKCEKKLWPPNHQVSPASRPRHDPAYACLEAWTPSTPMDSTWFCFGKTSGGLYNDL